MQFYHFGAKVVEYNVASTRSLLGLCSFKDGDYLSEFAIAEQKKWE